MVLVMLRCADGRLVSCDDQANAALALVDRVGDGGMFAPVAGGGGAAFRSVVTGQVLRIGRDLPESTAVEAAPGGLPSAYLAQLRETGRCLIPNILDEAEAEVVRAAVFDEMESQTKSEDVRGARAWGFVADCAPVLRFHTHPVMLWVLQEFMETPLLRAAHPPVPRVAAPGSGAGGWHNDTPYQQLMQRGYPEEGFPEAPLGVQCNVCIDEYRDDNGGTKYLPGSWALGRKPPSSDAEDFDPPDAACIEAPAGSVFCYHAATWHRMHRNLSSQPRLGLLQSFVPDFSTEQHAEHWLAGSTPDEADARERLAGWLAEDVVPKMTEEHEGLMSEVGLQLNDRQRRECEGLWVGGLGGGAAARL